MSISLLVKSPSIESEFDSLIKRVGDLSRIAAIRASTLDEDGAFPDQDIETLAAAGALKAPLPWDFGGLGLGTEPAGALPLLQVLRGIGHASLSLGRLYEGHVNALSLVVRFGTTNQIESAARDATAGLLFGMWNTQGRDGLLLEKVSSSWRLKGRKTFASGAGYILRPLITVRTNAGELFMVLPRLEPDEHKNRADMSEWRAHGMRASATGSYDFSGLRVEDRDIIGQDGDYHRQPYFSAGAWRFAAVQLGGIERLLDEARFHLLDSGRANDPHQLSRIGQAAMAAESARLFVTRAAQIAELPNANRDSGAVTAYVNMARLAVERAGLEMLEIVHRSVGLACFLRTNPIERLSRDLATYLRQPAPDRALTEAAAHVLEQAAPAADLWS
jgi:alkylation response protein AidB-like acyl-CoA dehydrogenase